MTSTCSLPCACCLWTTMPYVLKHRKAVGISLPVCSLTLHSAINACMSTAARQHSRLIRQYSRLQKPHRHSERQKAAPQQQAVQLKQFLNTLLSMGSSVQQTNCNLCSWQGEQDPRSKIKVGREKEGQLLRAGKIW